MLRPKRSEMARTSPPLAWASDRIRSSRNWRGVRPEPMASRNHRVPTGQPR
ncbi:hypothetical protein IEQ44_04620 [Nocardioides sp. Y6]|uniref:Uncharacterized protein n=1 Tax=Nocardioides malaquae TaxID=2773426 RepID=A0ABR9RQU0_9ACTN|nr:hypothetical protein [Nocardioides malaquae]MBE7323932.1 hypothetical protein [Nocardioides malaquae]